MALAKSEGHVGTSVIMVALNPMLTFSMIGNIDGFYHVKPKRTTLHQLLVVNPIGS